MHWLCFCVYLVVSCCHNYFLTSPLFNGILYPGCTLYGYVFPNKPQSLLMLALGVLSSSITIISATLLITLKITLATRQVYKHQFYNMIIKILVQSAAIVSILLLGLGILTLVAFIHHFDLSTTSGRFSYQARNYFLFAQTPISVSNVHRSHYH